MSDDSETTVWQKVRRKPRSEFEGEDRRAPPPHDYTKHLPLLIALVAALAAYFRMESQVDFNAQRIEEIRETDAAQWQRIGDLMGSPVVPR